MDASADKPRQQLWCGVSVELCISAQALTLRKMHPAISPSVSPNSESSRRPLWQTRELDLPANCLGEVVEGQQHGLCLRYLRQEVMNCELYMDERFLELSALFVWPGCPGQEFSHRSGEMNTLIFRPGS